MQEAIDNWNAAIHGRELLAGGLRDFDLVAVGANGALVNHHCKGSHFDPETCAGGGGPGNGGGGGEGPDITIQIKKGGGVVAGSAQSTFENGFRVSVRIQISGSSFGIGNADETVREIALHELGHALALGHHSNEADLMGRTVGSESTLTGVPSDCDLDGFAAAHQWLTSGSGTPALNQPDEIICPAAP